MKGIFIMIIFKNRLLKNRLIVIFKKTDITLDLTNRITLCERNFEKIRTIQDQSKTQEQKRLINDNFLKLSADRRSSERRSMNRRIFNFEQLDCRFKDCRSSDRRAFKDKLSDRRSNKFLLHSVSSR